MIEDLEHQGHYTAPEGKVIVPKGETENGTKSIWLAKGESIEDYELIDEVADGI